MYRRDLAEPVCGRDSAVHEEIAAGDERALWSHQERGDNRCHVHFNGKGLRAHGKAWAERVGIYLDNVMDQNSVIWDTPSRVSLGSMPLGNGDIALNVWVEENGDLLLHRTFGALLRGPGLARQSPDALATAAKINTLDLSIDVFTV